MKSFSTFLLIACVSLVSRLAADSIQIESGYIRVTVEGGKEPYRIGDVALSSASKAASFLEYIEKNWPEGSPSTILVEYKDKAVPTGDELFEAVLSRMAKSARWKVIRMPVPRGSIDSITTLSTLKKKWAEQVMAPNGP